MRRFMTREWDPTGVMVRMRVVDAGFEVHVSFIRNGYRPTYEGGGTYPVYTNKEDALAQYRRLLDHYKAEGYRITREPNLRAM